MVCFAKQQSVHNRSHLLFCVGPMLLANRPRNVRRTLDDPHPQRSVGPLRDVEGGDGDVWDELEEEAGDTPDNNSSIRHVDTDRSLLLGLPLVAA